MVDRRAPAKLNLYLHVVGRRADGYHLLDSLVAFADFGDRVSAVAAPSLTLSVVGPFAAELAGSASANLVWRAASLLAERAGIEPRAALTLEKNLPVASGIGGGSSDAAAALWALAELWGLDTGAGLFDGLAQALGADVPVCLFGRPAWLGGIGELVTPAPALPEIWVVLANPGSALATRAVFNARQGEFTTPARFQEAPRDAVQLAALLSRRRNDLAASAIALAPVIADVLAALESEPGTLIARMSGSGATCFALYAESVEARAASSRLRRAHPDWWIVEGKLF